MLWLAPRAEATGTGGSSTPFRTLRERLLQVGAHSQMCISAEACRLWCVGTWRVGHPGDGVLSKWLRAVEGGGEERWSPHG